VAITTSGTRTIGLANDLAALEGLSGTGLARRTGVDTWVMGTTVNAATEMSGILGFANGGTGYLSHPSGTILIGTGAGLTQATPTGTNGINITMGSGTMVVSNVFNPTPQALTDGATVNWNVTNGGNAVVTLAAAGRSLAISNPVSGYTYTIRIIQGSGGNKTITTYPVTTKWLNGLPPSYSTSAGDMDIISFYYEGGVFYGSWGPKFF
jgi:hypothetical protein